MRKHLYILLLILLNLFSNRSFAQTTVIDSLKIVLGHCKEDSNKAITLNKICNELLNTGSYKEALEKVKITISFAKKINYKKGIAEAYNTLGSIQLDQGDFKDAKENYEASLNLRKALNDKKGIAGSLSNLGIIFIIQGNNVKALDLFKSSLKIREEINDNKGIAICLNNIANIYRDLGDFNQAVNSHMRSLKIRTKIGDKSGIADSYKNICYLYWDQGNHIEALRNQLEALKIKKEIGDKYGIATCYNTIGSIYSDQGIYEEALKNHFKALKISEDNNLKPVMMDAYTNLGVIYEYQKNYSEALKNHLKALSISKDIGDKKGLAKAYGNLGILYYDKGDTANAVKNYNLAKKFSIEIDDKNSTALTYLNLGNIYAENDNYKSALKNYLLSLKIAEEINNKISIALTCINIGMTTVKFKRKDKSLSLNEAETYIIKGHKFAVEAGYKEAIKSAHEGWAELDSAKGDFKNSLAHYKLFTLYKDSLINDDRTKKITQQQMQYEFDKKEALGKAQREKENIIAIEEKQKQKIVLYFVITGLIIVLLFSFILYRRFKLTQKQNKIIERQKTEVDNQRVIADNLRVIAEEQKQLVEEHQKEIVDSITYAKRLQDAILPPLSEINENIPESFVLFKPKDIVAGDFYWAEKVDTYYFIAAADCTGHGVPGAMVSMVCSNALNRTVNEFGLIETGAILDNVRELVLDTFKKSGEDIKDGMDISLCRINVKNTKIQWSGANNPLWYFLNNELHEIKADKQPIGKYDYAQPFTTHNLELPKGTNMYMFTDGYADQFSFEGRKMTKKKFKDLVTSSQNKTMSEQKEIIENYFINWKQNAEQIDDVCIIGITL